MGSSITPPSVVGRWSEDGVIMRQVGEAGIFFFGFELKWPRIECGAVRVVRFALHIGRLQMIGAACPAQPHARHARA